MLVREGASTSSVHGPTLSVWAGLVTPADDAVMSVLPIMSVVARPLLLIVATVGTLEFHVATFVMSWVPVPVPAHGVAIAVNC